MSLDRFRPTRILVATCVLVVLAALAPSASAQDKTYAMTNLTGRLVLADGRPVEDATVRLLSTGETAEEHITNTDTNGEFSLTQVPYGSYVIEFTTVDGESIHGLNALPLGEHSIEMTLTLAKTKRSKSTLFSQPMNFQVDVDVAKWNKARFWKQFGIFFGIVITGGIAAL